MIGVTIVTPGQWRGICEMMGLPDLARQPHLSLNTDRLKHNAEIDAAFGPVWLTKTAEEWFERGLRYKLPLAVVPTMEELLRQKVHRDRGAFVPVSIAGVTFEAPVPPLHLERTPPKQGGAAPRAGEHHPRWIAPASTRPAHQAAPGTLPLTGMRIIDLTMGWAGPTGARHLCDLGANAVIENYSSEVLRKLELDYSVLKDVRPGLVMISMPAFGSFNAWSDCRAYGSTLEHASGLPSITGFPHDPPTMNQTAYGDPVCGVNAAA